MNRNRVQDKPTKEELSAQRLAKLYIEDETAWMEQTARLIRKRQIDHVDPKSLATFLRDMAKRDRREVVSRLGTLMAHLLKWDHQPRKRSNSWKSTIRAQRHELQDLLDSKTLKNHASKKLAETYKRALKLAIDETGLAEKEFPSDCPYTLDELLAED